MSEHINEIDGPPADVNLMLRAHAETLCLSREVIPVLAQIETGADLPEEQCGAALAYLEVTWLEARRRAQESDAAYRQLCGAPCAQAVPGEHLDELHGGACRYYEAVKELRTAIALRVSAVLGSCDRVALDLREWCPASEPGVSRPGWA